MLEIAYYLSCVIAGYQFSAWFAERIREDKRVRGQGGYSNQANLGVLIAYILLGIFPIVNTFIALLALQKVPLVFRGPSR